MPVYLDSQSLQFFLIGDRRRLLRKLGQHHTAHIQTVITECIDQTQHIHIIGNAQIPAHLVLFNIRSVDHDHDLRIVFHRIEHTDLGIRLKSRQYTGRMKIIKQLASEFQIQLASEIADPLLYLLRLQRQIFLIVKTGFLHFCLLSHALSCI